VAARPCKGEKGSWKEDGKTEMGEQENEKKD